MPEDPRPLPPKTLTPLPDADRQPAADDPSLGTLFRQLADDSRELIHKEATLAKAELTHGVRSLALNGALIGAGAVMLVVGMLVLTAFLVVGLGRLLDGQYWLSSLIIGGVFALVGVVAISRGRRDLRKDVLKPQQTLDTLRQNKKWVQSEVDDLKRDLAS